MDSTPRSDLRILIFANVSQRPFNNTLVPPVEACQRVATVTVIEPFRLPDFTSTGAAAPAPVPATAIERIANRFNPDLVICLGGGLFLPEVARNLFPDETVYAGIALSDPLGIAASLQIAPHFDLFYTHDPQTIPFYQDHGIAVRRLDHAADPELFQPTGDTPACDVIFVGKWTDYREHLLAALSERFTVHIHAHRGELQWRLPTLPELDTPEALSAALSAARLSIDFAKVEQPGNPFDGTYRMTPRTLLASACGTPALIEASTNLWGTFTPGREIVSFTGPEDLAETVQVLLNDEDRRMAIGRAALERVRRDHTWEMRIHQILTDAAGFRNGGTTDLA